LENKNQSQGYKFYGRRKGVRLSDRQNRLLKELLPEIRLDLETANLFVSDRDIRLEIGFGGGEHLVSQAMNNRQVLFIGAEPFINGIAKLLAAIEEKAIPGAGSCGGMYTANTIKSFISVVLSRSPMCLPI